MREVARELGISVTWKQFSLAIVNQAQPDSEYLRRDFALGRTFVAAERLGGNGGVDRLYLALGDVIHGQRLDPLDETVMREALVSAGHIPELMEAALDDPTTETEYRELHEAALALGMFGVPTLVFDGQTPGHFGPVVDPVPTGADALELWRIVSWVARHPYVWEMKKDRGGRRLSPLRAPGLLLQAAAGSADDDVDACAWVPTQPAVR
jgi:hypothetical protein